MKTGRQGGRITQEAFSPIRSSQKHNSGAALCLPRYETTDPNSNTAERKCSVSWEIRSLVCDLVAVLPYRGRKLLVVYRERIEFGGFFVGDAFYCLFGCSGCNGVDNPCRRRVDYNLAVFHYEYIARIAGIQ